MMDDPMMDELDRFVLTEDLPEKGLRAGDLGTIVMVHDPNRPQGGLLRAGRLHGGIYVFDGGDSSGGRSAS